MSILSKTHTKGKGFTLVELMVAIAIVAVISAIGASVFSESQKRGRDSKRKQDLRSIALALEFYYQQNKRYPCSNNAWQFSYPASNNWIVDYCNSQTNYLVPAYINSVPQDPLNTGHSPWIGTNYSYGYLSNNWQACAEGRNYILLTLLENGNDPEAYANKQNTVCGVTYNNWGISGKSFVITK